MLLLLLFPLLLMSSSSCSLSARSALPTSRVLLRLLPIVPWHPLSPHRAISFLCPDVLLPWLMQLLPGSEIVRGGEEWVSTEAAADGGAPAEEAGDSDACVERDGIGQRSTPKQTRATTVPSFAVQSDAVGATGGKRLRLLSGQPTKTKEGHSICAVERIQKLRVAVSLFASVIALLLFWLRRVDFPSPRTDTAIVESSKQARGAIRLCWIIKVERSKIRR